jgi:hypothetical protein
MPDMLVRLYDLPDPSAYHSRAADAGVTVRRADTIVRWCAPAAPGRRGGSCRPSRTAIRAEIDEAAWAPRYAMRSYPFDAPETGKIAVGQGRPRRAASA